MRWLRDARSRWLLLVFLWVVVIVLGIGGFVQQTHESGVHRSLLDHMYLTLQLATLNYDGTGGPLNWRLEVGRFVVPIMAASTVLQTVSVVFAEEIRRWRIRLASEHTIVAGLDEVGLRLAAAFAAQGERVVAIDPDEAKVSTALRLGERVRAMAGDPADPTTLAQARIDRAQRLVAVSEDDALNVAVAAAACCVPRSRRAAADLICSVQLGDAELARMLRASDLDAAGHMRVSYVSVHERAARALLNEQTPFEGPGARILVIGLGRLGRSLVLALAQQWTHVYPDTPMELTLVDDHAEGRWLQMVHRHPALESACRVRLVDVDMAEPHASGIEEFTSELTDPGPTWVAVVLDEERLALASAVFLHQRLVGGVPIVVRMSSGQGLGSLMEPAPGRPPAFPGVSVFPFLDRVCTVDSFDGGVHEQLAQALHELGRTNPHPRRPAARGTWHQLDDEQRDRSRSRVAGIVGDLNELGLDLVPMRRWGTHAATLTDEQLALLAEREHSRWFADQTTAGWSDGPELNDAAKQDPALVPWDDLPDDVRAESLEAARALPGLLARSSFEIVPLPDGAAGTP